MPKLHGLEAISSYLQMPVNDVALLLPVLPVGIRDHELIASTRSLDEWRAAQSDD